MDTAGDTIVLPQLSPDIVAALTGPSIDLPEAALPTFDLSRDRPRRLLRPDDGSAVRSARFPGDRTPHTLRLCGGPQAQLTRQAQGERREGGFYAPPSRMSGLSPYATAS